MKLATFYCLFAFSVLAAQHAFGLEENDQNAIKAVISAYTDAWNLNACNGFSDGFTEDADFVNIFGTHFSGKQQIEERHVQIRQTFLKDTQMCIEQVTLREVRPEVVVALVEWNLEKTADETSHSDCCRIKKGIFTQIFVKNADGWRITASQNTLKVP